MEVSLIIPTMNRPKLLLRLISYYASLKFEGKILIGDSSNAEIFRETARALESYKGSLDIWHRHLPGRSVAAAVLDMNEYLTTPYACLIPDDDFLVPRTLANCIQFLDSHPDYVAAHGVNWNRSKASQKPKQPNYSTKVSSRERVEVSSG